MFEHINTRICWKLALREIRFHKMRSILTILVAVLEAAVFSFVLFVASSQQAGYESQIRSLSNTQADILFTGLTKGQAESLSGQRIVKDAPWYQAVGTVSDGASLYQLAPYSKGYAPTVEAVPARGRLPQKENEIAMEVQAAYALGGTSRIGDTLTLIFTPEQGGEPLEQEFTLVGTWDSQMYSNIVWVSDELAGQFPQPEHAANVTAGVSLWRTWNIEERAEELAQTIGLTKTGQYMVNSLFQEGQAEHIAKYVKPTRRNLPVVFLCGFLMFFSIIQMMLELDVQFYGRMKSLGMTPLQMRLVVYNWVGILVLLSVPVGWLLGYGLTQWISDTFILPRSNLLGISTVLNWYDFALSLAGTWVTVLLAALLPAFKVSRMKASMALHYTGHPGKHGKKSSVSSKDAYRPNSLLRLAVKGMFRQKGRMVFVLAALILSACFSSVTLVKYRSLDMEKYVSNKFSFDYLVKGDGQKYNVFYDPDDRSLTPELYDRISDAAGAENISRVYYAETQIRLEDSLWKEIVDYYERNLEYYQEYLQYVGFEDALKQLKEEHTMTVAVYGVEQEFMRVMTDDQFQLSGRYDREQFEKGSFAYIAGMNKNSTGPEEDYDQPLPAKGTVLKLDGTKYTVMGTARRPYNSMFVKPDSAFYLECYISKDTFGKQYPGRSPVELVLTAPDGQEEKVEQIVEAYQEENGYNYFTISRQSYYDGGRSTAWTMFGSDIILSGVLLLIALLGYLNLILHRTLARSREFAVYRSLGMGRRELLKLLVLENILFMVLAGVLVYGASAAVVGPLFHYFNHSGADWWFTYHFTLLPVHGLMVLLVVLAAVLPVVCVHFTERKSITQRLA